MRKSLLAVFAAVVLIAGCGGPKPEVPSQQGSQARNKPDTSNIKIDGDPSTEVNQLAIEAIADLEKYWADEYPKLYDGDYKPIEGGLFASTPDSERGPECAQGYADV